MPDDCLKSMKIWLAHQASSFNTIGTSLCYKLVIQTCVQKFLQNTLSSFCMATYAVISKVLSSKFSEK